MLPSLPELNHLFTNNEECFNFLRSHHVFNQIQACPECDAPVHKISQRMVRCRRKACRKAIAITSGTLFANSKLSYSQILLLAYLWLADCNRASIILISGISGPTVTSFLGYFRSIIGASLDADDTVIGGQGIIVEIDESKFGKRKYNRGHRVEGAWVIGGVERTQRRLIFAEVVERRDARTLLNVISRHVAAGSIVHTDLWRGYVSIEDELDVQHFTVNHSINFVDPETGTHTNTIEGTWNGMKLKISPRHRTQDGIQENILEFIWRRKHEENLWGGFIDAMQKVHIE